VKRLAENASDQEQEDFLVEARLLSALNHVNLIKLVGVCTTTTPYLIALEYMENGCTYVCLHVLNAQTTECRACGGARKLCSHLQPSNQANSLTPILIIVVTYVALLGYLHRCRASDTSPNGLPQALTEHDLVSMAADVAAAMAYLESRHILHRDLAARYSPASLSHVTPLCAIR
jgi:serine/threonine protein kinase